MHEYSLSKFDYDKTILPIVSKIIETTCIYNNYNLFMDGVKMIIHKARFNENSIIELFIIWFLFQAVLGSSLLKYSNHDSIVTAIRLISIIARVSIIIYGVYFLSQNKINKSFLIPLVMYAFVVVVTVFYNHSYQFFDTLFIAFIFKDKIE